MFARVTTIEGDREQLDRGTETIREMVLPRARELPGFQGVISLVDRERGRVLTITLWDTEESLRASEEAANQLRQQATDAIGVGSPPSVDRYEVALYEVESAITA